MIGISLRFTCGRYHATPWGRHTNEAAPEWPPSPWRLLRSLVATWKRKLDPELAIEDVAPVFRLLASPPEFVLPPATLGHSRHFMPKKGDERTLIFDGFVVVDPSSSLTAVWPHAEISGPQIHILSRVLENLGFLGRAESWCEAALLREGVTAKLKVNCMATNGQGRRDGFDAVQVLCADPETAFSNQLLIKPDTRRKGRGRLLSLEESPRTNCDPNWHLCIETAQLHAERWSDPPGAKWVRYMRRNDCFRVESRRVIHRPSAFRPQVARFALDSAVLPLVSETLPVAEIARRMLMGIHGRLSLNREGLKGISKIFSGKDATGIPLRDHEHAYYLPTDENRDGRLDHITIVARDGFDALEIKALDGLRELIEDRII